MSLKQITYLTGQDADKCHGLRDNVQPRHLTHTLHLPFSHSYQDGININSYMLVWFCPWLHLPSLSLKRIAKSQDKLHTVIEGGLEIDFVASQCKGGKGRKAKRKILP